MCLLLFLLSGTQGRGKEGRKEGRREGLMRDRPSALSLQTRLPASQGLEVLHHVKNPRPITPHRPIPNKNTPPPPKGKIVMPCLRPSPPKNKQDKPTKEMKKGICIEQISCTLQCISSVVRFLGLVKWPFPSGMRAMQQFGNSWKGIVFQKEGAMNTWHTFVTRTAYLCERFKLSMTV